MHTIDIIIRTFFFSSRFLRHFYCQMILKLQVVPQASVSRYVYLSNATDHMITKMKFTINAASRVGINSVQYRLQLKIILPINHSKNKKRNPCAFIFEYLQTLSIQCKYVKLKCRRIKHIQFIFKVTCFIKLISNQWFLQDGRYF